MTISAGAEVADQHVLAHVGGEQLLVGDPVERPDEREHRQPEPEREQRHTVPAGEIGPPAAAEAHDGLQEEQTREHGCDDRCHGPDCAWKPMVVIRSPRASVCEVAASAAAPYSERGRRAPADLPRVRRDDGAGGARRAGDDVRADDWICLECEETADPDGA